MKKFNFKLQKILDIREKLELEQKNVLSKAASEYQNLVLKKQDILSKNQNSRKDIYSALNSHNFSIQTLRNIDHMQYHSDQLVRVLDGQIKSKQQIMEKEREKYNKLVKDRKSIEILKNNELKKHNIINQRIESSVMDEIANNQKKNN